MADTRIDHRSEKRIAVVMYGGVSLAIYIAGVAKELLSVVRATAPKPGDPGLAGVPDEALTPMERIYRAAASSEGILTTRVIIDVVSGTSAGGINGIFLAKALANDAPMDPILELWIEEGDLARLLNDAQSAQGTGLPPDRPPAALLNGRRMYVKLLEAFDAMDERAPQVPRCDPGRVDLFVTTTDVRGEITRLPVDNAVAREKRHRQRFHFTADGSLGAANTDNELGNAENPLLAFAARCTSSFPFAFEPFTWSDALGIEKRRKAAASWTDRLMFVGKDYEQRPFADGGYLDNKPFSYAIDELARRQSALEVERTLIYVEPDPEKLLDRTQDQLQKEKPDPIANVVSALTLPGYETIREDLERVVQRNGEIRQILAIEKTVEEMLRNRDSLALKPFSEAEWTAIRDLGPLVERYGVGYAAYHQFKLGSVVDSIASLVCSAGHVGRPELAQVIRDLAEVWVLDAYPSFSGQLQLLLDADFDYRLRKFSFVLRRLPSAADAEVRKARGVLKEAVDDLYSLRKTMRRTLGNDVQALRAGALSDDVLGPIADENGKERDASLGRLLSETRATAGKLKKYLEEDVRERVRAISGRVSDALKPASPAMIAIRGTYDAFENFDMVVYPIVGHGDVDEAVEVKITRISPADVEEPRARPLAGASLGHFGAFLEPQWRHNDILCGRLDGAETLLRQLLKDPAEADAKVKAAHEEIVEEMLRPYLESRILDLPPSVRKEALEVVADKKKLCALFKQGHAYDLGIDRARQVASAGRAGVIVEQILRTWALKKDLPAPRVLRFGVLLFAMLGQVSIPRTLQRTVAAYWGRLLAVLFLVIGVAGAVTNDGALKAAGLKGLAVMLALGVASLTIAAYLQRHAWVGRTVRLLNWLPLAAAAGMALWAAAVGAGGVARSIRLDEWLTPFDKFFVGIGLGLLVGTWFQDIWGDLRAFAFRLTHRPRIGGR